MHAISASPRPSVMPSPAGARPSPRAMPSLAWACSSPRRAFTLIEMLVVVVIIGILAGLITGAAIAARNKAKVAAISVEISQLDMALKEYKNKFGDYPPDFFGVSGYWPDGSVMPDSIRDQARAAVLRHLRKAFPRWQVAGADTDAQWADFATQVQASCNMDINSRDNGLTPASALVFWLGGLPQTGGATKLMGFCADPRHPFATAGSRLPPLFEFDEKRIHGYNDATQTWMSWPTYTADGASVPYVYFRARKTTGDRWEYAVEKATDQFVPFGWAHPTDGENVARPYLESAVDVTGADAYPELTATIRRWMNLTSFQIISPGLDNRFGCDDGAEKPEFPFRYAPTGRGCCPHGNDYDNITNFTEGKTLEDAME
jgi:prepilin-type N-terminal cleavage/methylation domain-containing protein